MGKSTYLETKTKQIYLNKEKILFSEIKNRNKNFY